MTATESRGLKLAVQQYEWGIKGDHSLVARLGLLGGHISSVSPAAPYAELWLGVHPNGSSSVEPDGQSLAAYIAAHGLPELPFLFKVLSVGQALSIQSHPNAELAKRLHAARPDIYKDPNPKPEMAIVLSPSFRALLGFRPWSEISSSCEKFPVLADLVGFGETRSLVLPDSEKTRRCYERLMHATSGQVATVIASVLANSVASEAERLALVRELDQTYPGGDVGVLAVFFLNLLSLTRGEAVFIPADTPHAYLSGEILECMQNSDNVIRGGLTPKFKDVDVLIESLKYEPFSGDRVAAEPGDTGTGWVTWRPLDLFGVTRVDSAGLWKSKTVAIGIVLSGSATISGQQRSSGWADVILPDSDFQVSQCSPDFEMYIADSRV